MVVSPSMCVRCMKLALPCRRLPPVASRPTEPTYKVDETEEVFATIEREADEEEEQKPVKRMKPKMKKKKKKIAVPT